MRKFLICALLLASPALAEETKTVAPAKEKAAPHKAPATKAASAPKAKEAAKPAVEGDAGKASLLTRFEKTCLNNSAAEGRSQKDLCTCLKSNLGLHLAPAPLSLLVRFYEGDAEAKAEVQKTKNAPLLDFDMETSEACLVDASYKAPQGPRARDDDENAGEDIVEAEKVQASGGKEKAKSQAKPAPEKAPALKDKH